MKLDELEKMAKETAAFGVHPSGEYIYSFYTEQLQAFAKLVAEHEREACAEVCDEQMRGKSIWIKGAEASALAIRARGQA
jgi:hypothetical protein